MILDVIATGSSGNSYLLRNGKECLIIEMGVPLKDVKIALDFNIRHIVGAVVSHKHKDHFGYHAEYEKIGVKAFYPWMREEESVKYGGFKIQAFKNPHGDIVSYGFYIKHEDMGKMLFLTDLEYCPYDMSNLNVNHILVECNYQQDMIDMDAPNFKHKVQGHMSFDTCKEFVRHNISKHLQTVMLIHSNPYTLDENMAVKQIKDMIDYDVNVLCAEAGLQITL